MGNQSPKASDHPTGTKCKKWTYIIAFAILFGGALVLMAVPIPESDTSQWAKFLEKKGDLLEVAAATALIMSLILASNPSGLRGLAVWFAGVLNFAAAMFSLEIWMHTGTVGLLLVLALLYFTFPIVIIALPMLRSPQGWADLIVRLWPISFIYITMLTIQSALLLVPSINQWAIEMGILGSCGFWILPVIPLVIIIVVFDAFRRNAFAAANL